MKRIAVLGCTGSIGTQTLDVVRRQKDRLQVTAVAAATSGEKVRQIMAEFGCQQGALFDEVAAEAHGLPGGIDALCDLAVRPDVDTVVISVAGVIGLKPTIAALRAGKHVALASKEVLVSAGSEVMRIAREHGATITPIDSEHSAIFQCLQGSPEHGVEKLILTASGGPFFGKTKASLEGVTVAEALNHPTWAMGGKITIDSATLMNKGLEMIEARWLFDIPTDQIEVLVHRQSVIHSMVQFKDGSVLGQLGWPDMRLPIQYALMYPERCESHLERWDPLRTPQLTFAPCDEETFECLALARQADHIGGTMPCVMNAANEEAANGFLRGQIGFLDIGRVVRETMEAHTAVQADLDSVFETDQWARSVSVQSMERIAP